MYTCHHEGLAGSSYLCRGEQPGSAEARTIFECGAAQDAAAEENYLVRCCVTELLPSVEAVSAIVPTEA